MDLVFDVGAGSEPLLNGTGSVAHGNGAVQVPAISLGPEVQSIFNLECLPGTQTFFPFFEARDAVVWMDSLKPAIADRPTGVNPGNLVPASVDVVGLTVLICGHDNLGNRLRQHTEMGLAFVYPVTCGNDPGDPVQ